MSSDDEPTTALPAPLHTALEGVFGPELPDREHIAADVLAYLRPRLDPPDAVDELFAYDGPHTTATITDAARVMAAVGRYLNNATQYPGRLSKGGPLGAVLSSVRTTLYQLHQLTDQLADTAQHLAEDRTLYSYQTVPAENSSHEQWMLDQHNDGVRSALQVADQLREVRDALMVTDQRGLPTTKGLAPMLDRPTKLANQLGHTS